MKRASVTIVLATLAWMGGEGCALTPKGTQDESARAEDAQASYAAPPEERVLLELPERANWRDVLQRALLANGDLEAAVHEWRAALARVDQAAGYPNTNAMVGMQYLFSDENMKAFDRMTFTLGFDTMENLVFPSKARRAGEAALDAARASGERVRETKFAVQERVLGMWTDYALLAEEIRVRSGTLALREVLSKAAASRLRTGGRVQESLAADLALTREQNDLAALQAQMNALRAEINGMLARDLRAPLDAPDPFPDPRPLPATDAALLEVAVDRNPELAALSHEVAGREDALALARMRWIPDVNPMAIFTGSISKSIGGAIVLPTTFAEIRGAIRESEAMLEASRAILEQARRERAASFVATLAGLRDAERQSQWFQERVLPAAEHAADAARESYSTGSLGLTETLEAEEAALEARFAYARVRAEREKLLARLESLAGVDVETLAEESVP
jgi:outer membrane protein TolC